ncbi:MAG: hypothetical protein IPG32_00140 [Saprospirales bacterium]|nr:hypothetical protein [Saprospirales bacterium]
MRNPGLYAVICSLSILFLSPSCVVKKPDSGRISGLDYNKRVTVYDAHYRKKPTVFGISFVVAGTAAGGYLGYQSNLIGYQDGPDRKFVQPANAVIGALIGYSLTNLCNYALGQNKTYPVNDVRKWAKDANKNYLLLSQSSSSFTLMHNSAESSFLVKNIQDARDFRTCFPNSSYSNSIALQGKGVVRREELPELLALFPGNANASDMKSGFLAQSTSLAQCIEAKNKYPELSADAERKASGYVSTLDDLRTFKNNFANSGYANEIVTNLYPRLKRAELPQLVDMYPSLPVIPSVKSKYLSLGATVGECIDAKDKYPELKADAEQKAAGYVAGLSDLKAFKNSFSNSAYANDIVTRLYPKLSRSELPQLVEMYPSLAVTANVKKEYINQSNGFDQFLEAINRYPKMVDNEEYRLANYVHNVSTIRAFQSKFGQDCENIDLAFKNASGKINWIEIPDLVQATPNASEELKDISLNNYRGYLAQEFGNCRDEASCNSFISRFSGKFEAAELVKKASEKYDYYSAKTISDWANYAAKYPDQMQEADDKAFAPDQCN